MTTPQRPVGCVVEVRYSARRPAASLRSRSIWAYLSSPTQPMKTVELGEGYTVRESVRRFFTMRRARQGSWEPIERTWAPRAVFCAAPPAMSFALRFWSRSS